MSVNDYKELLDVLINNKMVTSRRFKQLCSTFHELVTTNQLMRVFYRPYNVSFIQIALSEEQLTKLVVNLITYDMIKAAQKHDIQLPCFAPKCLKLKDGSTCNFNCECRR